MIHNSNQFAASSLGAPKIPPQASRMQRLPHRILLGLAALFLLLSSASAHAACGAPTTPIKPMAWHFDNQTALLQPIAFEDDQSLDPIVGMWHVIFQAHSMNGQSIPPTVIDNAVVVWHSDGTEIMNSSRPAQDGNFCLGVWKHTGHRQYLLNHIPWAGNDPSNAPGGIGNPQGGVQIIEHVTLNGAGNGYSGTFTLRTYDTSGKPGVWFSGLLVATRITPTTSITTLF